MNCPKCGQPLKEGSPFCGNCGTPIEQAPAWEPQEQNNAQAAQPAVSASVFQYQPSAAPRPVSQPSVHAAPNVVNAQTFPGSAPLQPQIGQVPGTQTPIDFSQVINNGALPTQPPHPPKKKNTGLIVGIVIGVVAAVVIGIVVLAIIGYNVQKKEAETTAAPAAAATTKASDGFDAASPTTNPYTVPFDGSYTKGAFDGTEYVNPWANLRIPLPSGWKEDDAAEYADWESEEIVDCGFTCTAPDGDNLVVLFIHSETDATADDYRDAHDKSIKEGEIPLKNDPAHSRATIAGKEYLGSDYVFAKDGEEFAESMYVRLIDDTFVVILIFGDTVDENDDLMKTIIKPY